MHLPRFITRWLAPDESRFSCLTKGILKSMREQPDEWEVTPYEMGSLGVCAHHATETQVFGWAWHEVMLYLKGVDQPLKWPEHSALLQQVRLMVVARKEAIKAGHQSAAAPIKTQWERLGCPPAP